MPTPLYDPTALRGAHRLHYSWTGWPSGDGFPSAPTELITLTKPLWLRDGLDVVESRWMRDMVQILFAASPHVSPQFIATRAKGRLDHAIRAAGLQMPISRKVALRAIGENTRHDVETYIETQVKKEQFADDRFARELEQLIYIDDACDLLQPTPSSHGRYWYNLHLVLVTEGRFRIVELEALRQLRAFTLRIAQKKSHALSRLTVMPDHLHASLRPKFGESPHEVAASYLNNLAHGINHGRMWQAGYYVGTFGEYTTHSMVGRDV